MSLCTPWKFYNPLWCKRDAKQNPTIFHNTPSMFHQNFHFPSLKYSQAHIFNNIVNSTPRKSNLRSQTARAVFICSDQVEKTNSENEMNSNIYLFSRCALWINKHIAADSVYNTGRTNSSPLFCLHNIILRCIPRAACLWIQNEGETKSFSFSGHSNLNSAKPICARVNRHLKMPLYFRGHHNSGINIILR